MSPHLLGFLIGAWLAVMLDGGSRSFAIGCTAMFFFDVLVLTIRAK